MFKFKKINIYVLKCNKNKKKQIVKFVWKDLLKRVFNLLIQSNIYVFFLI